MTRVDILMIFHISLCFIQPLQCDIVEVRSEELPHFARSIRLTAHQNHFTVHGFGDGLISYWCYEPFGCYFVQEVHEMTHGPSGVILSNDGSNVVIIGSDGVISCCGIDKDLCGHKSHERKLNEKRKGAVVVGAQVESEDFEYERFPIPWTEWHKRFTFLTELTKAKDLFSRVKKTLGEIQSSVTNLMEANEKIVFPEYRFPLLMFSPRAHEHIQAHIERSDFFEELLLYYFYKKAKSWQLCSLKIKRKYWDIYPQLNYKPYSVKAFRKNQFVKNFPLKNEALIEDIDHVKAQIRRTLDASMEMKGSIWRLPWLVCLQSFDDVVPDKSEELEPSIVSGTELKGDFHADLQMLMKEAEQKAKREQVLRRKGKFNQFLTYYVSVDPADRMQSEERDRESDVISRSSIISHRTKTVDQKKDLISQLGGQMDLATLESAQVDFLFSTWREERKVDKEKEKRKKFFTVRLRAAHSCSEITLEELGLLNYFHGSNAPVYLSIDPLLCSPLELNSPFQTHIQCPLIRRIIMHIKVFFDSELDNLRELKIDYVRRMKETTKRIVKCIEDVKTKTKSRKIPKPPEEEDYLSEEEIYKLLSGVEPKIPSWEQGAITTDVEDSSFLKKVDKVVDIPLDEDIFEFAQSAESKVSAIHDKSPSYDVPGIVAPVSSKQQISQVSVTSIRPSSERERRKMLYDKLIKEIALLRCDLLEPKRNTDRCFRKFLKLRRALETDIIGERLKLNWMARKKTIVLELSFKAKQLKDALAEQENLLHVLIGTNKRLKARLDEGMKTYEGILQLEKDESDKFGKFITNTFKDDVSLLNSAWEVIRSRPTVNSKLKSIGKGLLNTLVRAIERGREQYKMYQQFLPEELAHFLQELSEWETRIHREYPKMAGSIVARFRRKINFELSLEVLRGDLEIDKMALTHTARSMNESNMNIRKMRSCLTKCFTYCKQWIDTVKVQIMVDNSNFMIETKGSCYDYHNSVLVDDETLLNIFNTAIESGKEMISATSEFKESTYELKHTVTDYKWWQHLLLLERQEITAIENMRRNQYINYYIEQVVRKKSEPRDLLSRLNFEDNRIRLFFENFHKRSAGDVASVEGMELSKRNLSHYKAKSQVYDEIITEKGKEKNIPKLKFYLVPHYEEFMNEFEKYVSWSEDDEDGPEGDSSVSLEAGGSAMNDVRAGHASHYHTRAKSVVEDKMPLIEVSGKKVRHVRLMWPALDQFDSCVQMTWLAGKEQQNGESEFVEPEGSEISEWNYYKMWLSENREMDALASSTISREKESSAENDLYECVKSELGSSGDDKRPDDIVDELSKRLMEETDKEAFWLYRERQESEDGRSIYSLTANPGNENLVATSLRDVLNESKRSIQLSAEPSFDHKANAPSRKSVSIDVSYSFPDPPQKISTDLPDHDSILSPSSTTISSRTALEVTQSTLLKLSQVGVTSKRKGESTKTTLPEIKVGKKKVTNTFQSSVAKEKLPKIEKSYFPPLSGKVDFQQLQQKSTVKTFMTNIDNLLKPPEPPTATKLPEIPTSRKRAASIPNWVPPPPSRQPRRFSEMHALSPQVYFVTPHYDDSTDVANTSTNMISGLPKYESDHTDLVPIKRSLGYSDLSFVGIGNLDVTEGSSLSKAEFRDVENKEVFDEDESTERISGPRDFHDDFPPDKSSTIMFAERLFTKPMGDDSNELSKMTFRDMFKKYNIKEKIQDFFYESIPMIEEEESEKPELNIGRLSMDLSPEMTKLLYDNDSFTFLRKLPHTLTEFRQFVELLQQTKHLIPREQFLYLESECEKMIARPRLDFVQSLEFKTAWEQWIESILNEDNKNVMAAKKLAEQRNAIVPVFEPRLRVSVNNEESTELRTVKGIGKKDDQYGELIASATKKYWEVYGRQYKARLPKKIKKQLKIQKKACLKSLEDAKNQTISTIEEIKKNREACIAARNKLIHVRKQLDRETKLSGDTHYNKRFNLVSEIAKTKRAVKSRCREIELLETTLEKLLLRKYPTFDYVIKN